MLNACFLWAFPKKPLRTITRRWSGYDHYPHLTGEETKVMTSYRYKWKDQDSRQAFLTPKSMLVTTLPDWQPLGPPSLCINVHLLSQSISYHRMTNSYCQASSSTFPNGISDEMWRVQRTNGSDPKALSSPQRNTETTLLGPGFPLNIDKL